MKKLKIGTFKLKDKLNKNAIKIDLSMIKKELPDLRNFYVVKVPRENNKIDLFVEGIGGDNEQVSFNKS